MCKQKNAHLETFFRSIRVLVETRNHTDFDDEIGQRLLPMTRLFIIYSAMARQEDIQGSLPIWDQYIGETTNVAELRQLAPLPRRIRLATPDELSHLAQLTNLKIQSLSHMYMALPHERLVVAEHLAMHWCFRLEIFKRSNTASWRAVVERILFISNALHEIGLGGHCVASYSHWHAITVVNSLEGLRPGNAKG